MQEAERVRNAGDPQRALGILESASAECGADKACQAELFAALGDHAEATGELRTALARYEDALAIRRELEDSRGEAATFNGIGLVYDDMGQKQKALEYYERALSISHELGDWDGEAAALHNMGNIYGDLGQTEKALEYYERVLSMSPKLVDRSGDATTLNNIGTAYFALGQKRRALEYYERALSMSRNAVDRSGEATTLNNIGSVHDDLGQRQQALDSYNAALSIYSQVQDRSGVATTQNNIGRVYDALGQKEKALDYYKVALQAFHDMGERSSEAATLNNIGRVHFALREKEKALEYYELALSIRREVMERRGEATTLTNIGAVYAALGQNEKALERYELALPIFREVGDRGGEATVLSDLGSVYGSLGQRQKAVEDFELALPMFREVGDRSGEAATLYNIASAVRAVSADRAVLHAKQAVNILQSLRVDVGPNDELQRSYASSISGTYRFLADLLAEQGRIIEAQQVMDLLKSDEMGRLLRRSAPTGGQIGLDLREAAQDKTYRKLTGALAPLHEDIGELRRKGALSAGEQQRLAAIEQKLEKTEAELKSFFDGLAEKLFRASRDRKIEGREHAALAELLSNLPRGTVAVYTIAGETSLQTILYTRGDHTRGVAQVSYPELAKTVFELRQALREPQGDVETAGARLYELLVAPIAEKLEEAKARTIMWSLDGPLRYVPLAVLRDVKQKKWLVEEYRNVVITTASHTRLTTAPARKWTALGLGVTKKHQGLNPLAGVARELEAVVRDETNRNGAIPGRRLLDEAFTREAMVNALNKHETRVVHISSHYVFEPPTEQAAANGSYLLLGDGSRLTLKELDGMADGIFRGVDLVTLSACDTAMGADRMDLEGAEVDGLALVAQQKGAKAVLATLWPVEDVSTSAFMAELYRRREGGKKSKAEALQETQLAFLRGEVKPQTDDGDCRAETETEGGDRGVKTLNSSKARCWTHPYHWAPFILIGNWM